MNEKIKEIIKNALKNYNIEKIILFGSRARGDFDEFSDYDILVSLKEELDRKKRNELTDIVLQKLAEEHIAANLIIRSSMYIDRVKNEIGNAINYAMHEGITL